LKKAVEAIRRKSQKTGVALQKFTPSNITDREFIQILDTMKKQKIGCANEYAAALKNAAAQEGIEHEWLYRRDMKAMIKAVKKHAKKEKLPCGTVSEPMFEDLKKYLLSREKEEEFYAVVMGWVGKLRIGELGVLDTEAARLEAGITWLALRMWKQGSEDINPEPKALPGYMIDVFKTIVTKKYGAPAIVGPRFLFGKAIDARLRQVIKEAAGALKWDKRFRWTGPHVLRHGGSGDARDKLANRISDAVLSIVGQQSTGTFRYYATDGDERLMKKRRLEKP
jgi:hypothetical protein